MKNLTRKQLYQICQKNKYILVKFTPNIIVGINCKIGLIASKKYCINDTETNYSSWQPCNFMEYITHKTPFL